MGKKFSSQYEVGSVFDTRESGKAEVIEYIDSKHVVIKFLNTGNVKTCCPTNLKKGFVKDMEYFSSLFKFQEGTIHDTKNFGKIVVVKYNKSNDVLVRFLSTGNEYITSTGCIKEGKIADSIYKEQIEEYRKGLTFDTKDYGKFIVTNNIGTDIVDIMFLNTGTEKRVSKDDVLSLSVTDDKAPISRTSEDKFCVYLHKDKDGIVRYVGEGTVVRAYSKTRKDQPKWEEMFLPDGPIVEIVKDSLTKEEAEFLEKELRIKYEDTIINYKYATKIPHVISFDVVGKYVYYDETSPTCLRWKIKRQNHANPDDVAGHMKKDGYVTVEICGINYAAHRIVWTLINGEFDPGLVVDHIDGDKHNNRISNLRLVSHRENSLNKLVPIPESGYRYIRKLYNGYMLRWYEGTTRKAASYTLRTFNTIEECLVAALKERDNLVSKGYITKRVKEGEESIE